MLNEALSVIGLFFKFTIVKMQRTIINDLIIKKNYWIEVLKQLTVKIQFNTGVIN